MRRDRDEKLRDLEVKSSGGKRSQVKIRTQKAKDELFQKHRSSLYGSKLRTGFTAEEQERGRRAYVQNAAAGKQFPEKTKSQLVRWWDVEEKDLPDSIGLGICIHCDIIAMSFFSDEPDFHKTCHDEWERTEDGRRFQSRKMHGKKASLPSPTGRPMTRENLKLHYSWAIKHYLSGKSYDSIAAECGIKDWSSVRDAVQRFIDRLPPPDLVTKLLSERFHDSIMLLLQTAGRSIS